MPHPPLPGEQPPGEHAEELLAILAHELRRPLTALLGALMTLQHRTQALSGAQQQELLGMARRQSEQLQRLLDQLLAAASVDQVHAHPARPLVDVAALAEGAGHVARLAHPHHPITIAAAGTLPVRVDPLAISSILGNLLDNAAAYSRRGRPSNSRPAETADTRWSPSRIKGPGSRWPTATGSSSGMCACTLPRPAPAAGSGLGSTSPGGWPPRTAVGCSSPIRQVLEVPGLSCACPWQRGRRGVAAPAGRLRSDRATCAAVASLGHLEPNRSETRDGAGRPATVLPLASQYRQ
jgi:hypothetical protein